MNKLDLDYQNLLEDILENGIKKETRNGGTISVFGRHIRHKMSDGFPLLTTKKMPFKTITTELLWFLRGDTNIKFLVNNGCHIWDGDAYQSYCKRYWELGEIAKIEYGSSYYNHETNEYEFETYSKEEFVDYIKTNDAFAKKWGELGPVYGKQWRNWAGKRLYTPHTKADESFIEIKIIDQIANLIQDLKTNPDSRRLMVNAWNVGEIDEMTLPPCHYGFQVYTRELSFEERFNLYNQIEKIHFEECTMSMLDTKNIPTRAISLMYNARSQDVPLGTPFNLASYGLLLEIIGKMVNMVPDELITNMGDCHIYLNQVDGIKEQLTREPYPLPTLKHMKTDEFYKALSEDLTLLTHLDNTDFKVENYQSHPTIKLPLSN
jgi:thymidylate synthase